MAAALFYGFAALTVLFTLSAVLLRDPVTSAVSLVASFFSVSALFVLLHAPFLGVIQLLVYTGAILVLFLYVLMLLDLRKERAPFSRVGTIARWASLAAVATAVALLMPLLEAVGRDGREPLPESFGSLGSVGGVLLGPYALLFEAVSLVLLAGMLGVIVLAPSRKERQP